MHLLNKLGDELVKRKQILLENKDQLSVDDTSFIIKEHYYRNGIISDEIKNSILNNNISMVDFQKTLLKYDNFKKDTQQIKSEIAIFANKLEDEFKIQEMDITRKKNMKIGNTLTTINIFKTINITKEFMQKYVGLEDDDDTYTKAISKCVIPFFILRIKKIIKDFSKSELLKSNYIKVTSSKPYTKGNADLNTSISFDLIIEVEVETLEREESYSEVVNFVRVAFDSFEEYYQSRIME